MKVEVRVYDRCKYEIGSEEVVRRTYTIDDYEIKSMTDEEILADGFDEFDEYQEYLILHFADGTTSTFRNSHVDMFEA